MPGRRERRKVRTGTPEYDDRVTGDIHGASAEAWRSLAARFPNYDLVIPGTPAFVCLTGECPVHCCKRFSVSLGGRERDRLAALIGLAAHLKEKDGSSLPEAMSRRAEGADRNAVSDLRFARLLDSPDLEALFVGLRRLMLAF